eukprot:PhM_4_TR5242/c0_g1_i1/m.7580
MNGGGGTTDPSPLKTNSNPITSKRIQHQLDYLFGEARTSYTSGKLFSMRNPVMMFVWGGMLCYTAYSGVTKKLLPMMEESDTKRMHGEAPFVDSHNEYFNIGGMHDTAPSKHPRFLLTNVSTEFLKPSLVSTDASEVFKDTDVTVMQVVDEDRSNAEQLQKSYYRSMHFVSTSELHHDEDPAAAKKKKKKGAKEGVVDNRNVVQSMVKCVELTKTNNCIPEPRDLLMESSRKLLTAVAMTAALSDPSESYFPMRAYTRGKDGKNMLCVGLGAGSMPSYVARTLPHFKTDIVEVDPVVVRTAKRYFGFREKDNLNIFVEDAAEYMRELAASRRKKYDLIMLDACDSSGRIPIHLARLDFLTNVRKSLNERGILVAAIPNSDGKSLAATIANWRLAFENRSVILLHCRSQPMTVALTFCDDGALQQPKFGTVGSRQEFKELLRAFLLNNQFVDVDLTKEVTEDAFQQLVPGKRYMFHNVKV